MDKRLKRSWIKDLLSGKFKQGKRFLCQQDVDYKTGKPDGFSYCCLGVLGERLADKGILTKGRPRSSKHSTVKYVSYGKKPFFLPQSVIDSVGISKEDQRLLGDMNDGTNGHVSHTFEKIAKWIQDNL